ncbi:YciI family protein [Heyndrickxia sp. MSNUG]|uniref:YciI family protein n=1 Tax=Heyndrickxia sp. MSNUG TaxID=3136677 RepID=UPI003C2F87BF
MDKFVVILKEKRTGQLDANLLNLHIEHLRHLSREGKLMIAGPFKNNEQGMLILICEDIEEAISLVESDPFVKEKYYNTYEINELIVANEENNWLMDNPQTTGNLVH